MSPEIRYSNTFVLPQKKVGSVYQTRGRGIIVLCTRPTSLTSKRAKNKENNNNNNNNNKRIISDPKGGGCLNLNPPPPPCTRLMMSTWVQSPETVHANAIPLRFHCDSIWRDSSHSVGAVFSAILLDKESQKIQHVECYANELCDSIADSVKFGPVVATYRRALQWHRIGVRRAL